MVRGLSGHAQVTNVHSSSRHKRQAGAATALTCLLRKASAHLSQLGGALRGAGPGSVGRPNHGA